LENLHQLEALLNKKDWTAEEKQWLLDYLENNPGTALQYLQRKDFQHLLAGHQQVDPVVSARLLSAIHAQLKHPAKPARVKDLPVLIKRIAIAAVLAGLLLGGAWYWLHPKPATLAGNQSVSTPHHQPDLLPGGNKAVLTLANGAQIILDDAQNGLLTQQGNTAINKQDGQLIYNTGLKEQPVIAATGAPAIYNTVQTPRGGQYNVVLSDGSKVWLNAASSMRYPIHFSGPVRQIEISGEAYLEVAHNAAQPFIVSVRSEKGETGTIKVLGTHFNVNAYDDEQMMSTTLLEGKVEVVNRSRNLAGATGNQETSATNQPSTILKPGQQAVISAISNASAPIKVKPVDVETVVAWKNGFFEFDGNTIQSVMRQLARWYDVSIVYEGPLPNANFVGTISRHENISKVLKMLELTNVVQFKIQEKNAAGEAAKIIVMQKR
jgi:ferric-dicitrate binding protein FerR (iron transport regulator)